MKDSSSNPFPPLELLPSQAVGAPRPRVRALSVPVPRRSVLGWLSGGAALATLPALSACGGGGGGGGGWPVAVAPPPPADPEAPISDERRIEVLETVTRKGWELREGRTREQFVQALAEFMATLPEYAATGVDAETISAWGHFRDGRVHIISANRNSNEVPEPDPGEAPAAVSEKGDAGAALAKAAVELPASATARVLHSFGNSLDRQPTVTVLKRLLGNNGYAVHGGVQGDARVSTLREVQGDGFFYINTHGGASNTIERDNPKAPALYSIQSSTQVSLELEGMPDFKDDLKNWRLTYYNADIFDVGPTGEPIKQLRYGITANFVQKYWKFSDNAIVLINACSSARTSEARWSGAFVSACHNAGAAVYLGWNETVTTDGADKAPRYFVDRLIGANAIRPEDPHQRPFAWDLVMQDMKKKNLTVDSQTKAELLAIPRPGQGKTHLLAPTIERLQVSEYDDELVLLGGFGSVEGVVEIGGKPATMINWKEDRIRVQLPRIGEGCAGPVVARVGDRRSNVRQLTMWTIPFKSEWIDDRYSELRVKGTGTVRLRADVGPARQMPGEAPQQGVVYAIGTRDSTYQQVASGTHPLPPDCSISWTGTQDFAGIPENGTPLPPDTVLMSHFKVDTQSKTAWLGLALGMRDGSVGRLYEHDCRTTGKIAKPLGELDGPTAFARPDMLEAGALVEIPALALTLNKFFSIPPRTFHDEELTVWIDPAVPQWWPESDAAV